MIRFSFVLPLLGFVFINNAAAATCTYYQHTGTIACLSSAAVKMNLPSGFSYETTWNYLIANNSLSENYVGGTTSKPRGVCVMRAPSTTQSMVIIKGPKSATCPATLGGALNYTGPNADKIKNCTVGSFKFYLTKANTYSDYISCQYGKLTGTQKHCYWDSFWSYPDWVQRTVTKRTDKKTFDYFEKSGLRCN